MSSMPYGNECSLFLRFDKSGTGAQMIEGMFDAVVMKDFLPKLDAYVAQPKTKGEI
ncbi:hypothetical protein VTI74DRAFT_6672 [Chaetomium olivicolor]